MTTPKFTDKKFFSSKKCKCDLGDRYQQLVGEIVVTENTRLRE